MDDRILALPVEEEGEVHYDVYVDGIFSQTCDETEVGTVIKEIEKNL